VLPAVSEEVNPTMPSLQHVSTCVIRDLGVGEPFACRVSGTSMLPTLKAGDEVVAERCARDSTLFLGDLLVIELPDAGLVVHRLLSKGRDAVRTRGDGSGVMDPPVPWKDVLGRVIEASREGADVLPGSAARLWAWLRHFSAAAAYRLKRRMQGHPPESP
jgi:hypothetical protein